MATRKVKVSAGGEVAAPPVSITWDLARLPSSQHRAGLAGLLLFERWLRTVPGRAGVFEVTDVGPRRLTLRADQPGMRWAFDQLYAASREETESSSPWRDAVPVRIEERVDVSPKGKPTTKKVYVYEVPVPKAGPVVAYDPTGDSPRPVWTKLWRDFVWTIMRGVPAQRLQYKDRAEGNPTSDGEEALKAISRPDRSESLPSTYYLGAQQFTAERVDFRDTAGQKFLLHFWPLVASLYVPTSLDLHAGKSKDRGIVAVIPDVAALDDFVLALEATLLARSPELSRYRPRAAVIDLPAEAALDLSRRLRDRLAAREGHREVSDLVAAFDVFHMEKDGNNVRTLWSGRLDPDRHAEDEHERIRHLKDALFRRQRVSNLLQGLPWFHGFDTVLASVSHKAPKADIGSHPLGFASRAFRQDARQHFEQHTHRSKMTNNDDPSLERAIYKVVQHYVYQRLSDKYGLSWEKVQGTPREAEYRDAREKITRDAFLAIRGRRDDAFVEYFAGTFGSVGQRMKADEYVFLTRALRNNPADARTLTLLALSAVA